MFASKSLAAQQAAGVHWQATVPASSDAEIWRSIHQSSLQVGVCSQACGLHVEHCRCLQAASVACWVPTSKIA